MTALEWRRTGNDRGFSWVVSQRPRRRFIKAAQELFKKGEPGSHMYVVKSGEVQVVDGNHVFETVSPGGIVGEMSLISDEPKA